jgi:uncharacterized protein YdeI (YjbR/CyaY-like superfamily)
MGHADAEQVEFASRDEWRAWLADNHEPSSGVWVIYFKKSAGQAGPTYEDLIEEALCFGWIDGTARSVDEHRTSLYFCPRRKGSAWAASNKARVERLIAGGRMAPAGLAAIERAKSNGSWTILDRSESLTVPEDLASAFTRHPGSREAFDAFPPSTRKQLIYWVDVAKRPATRVRRADEVARQAQQGIPAHQPPPEAS